MTILLHRRQRLQYRDQLRSHDPHCLYCGRYLRESATTLDHVVPVSKGGTHDHLNLALSCCQCNAAKGERTLVEWLQNLQNALRILTERAVISPEITAPDSAPVAPNSISPEIKFPNTSESKDA